MTFNEVVQSITSLDDALKICEKLGSIRQYFLGSNIDSTKFNRHYDNDDVEITCKDLSNLVQTIVVFVDAKGTEARDKNIFNPNLQYISIAPYEKFAFGNSTVSYEDIPPVTSEEMFFQYSTEYSTSELFIIIASHYFAGIEGFCSLYFDTEYYKFMEDLDE